ncbi:MAG TPA: 50S ribosomal protein L13 [Bacteroidia bacterium]
MDALSYKTVYLNKDTVKKEWLIVDAENEVLGRLSSKLAYLLRGKHKTGYTPHVDCGDNIIVINAEKVKFTGKKLTDKVYKRYTGFLGGERFSTPREVLAKNPKFLIERAVRKMLPTTRLGDAVIRNLHVYAGTQHPHEAQQPKAIKLNTVKEHNK